MGSAHVHEWYLLNHSIVLEGGSIYGKFTLPTIYNIINEHLKQRPIITCAINQVYIYYVNVPLNFCFFQDQHDQCVFQYVSIQHPTPEVARPIQCLVISKIVIISLLKSNLII